MKRNLVLNGVLVMAGVLVAAGPSLQTAQAGQGKDPFEVEKPKTTVVAKTVDDNKPVLKPYPPLAQRQQEYLSAKASAKAKGMPEPNPIAQYLVTELVVTGVFETENGIGAFVEATPTKTTFFVGPKTRVYNGEIISINTGADFNLGQVLFNERTVYVVGKGKKQKETVEVSQVPKAVGARTAAAK